MDQMAQEELNASDQKFRAIFENTPAGLIITDDRGVVLECNRCFADMFGANVQAYIGINLLECIPAGPVRQNLLGAITDGKLHRYEGPCRSIMTGRDLDVVITSEMSVAGQVFTVIQDVTQSKRNEVALRESEERFRKVVEHSPFAMALVSSDGIIEYINLKAIETFGYLPQDIPNMDRWWVQAYPDRAYREEVIAQWMGLLQEALAHNRKIEQREYRVTCKNGSVKIAAIFGVWLANKVLVIFDDITERRKMEERLRESEERFRTFMESSPIIAWMKDAEGRYVYLNQRCDRHFWGGAGDRLGKTDYQFWPREVAQALRANDLAAMKSRQHVEVIEETPRPEGGHAFWLISKFPLRDAAGRSYIGGVGVDVTDRIRAEEALRQARDELELRVQARTAQLEEAKRELELDIERREKAESEKEQLSAQLRQSQVLEAVGRLAGGVAHDFNNLLAGVLGCAWAARVPRAKTKDVHRELNRIQELCKQGGEVTRQLLAVARQSAEVTTRIDLREVLRQLRTLIERGCPKTVSVVFDVAPELPDVSGDRGLFTSALLNVCLNARDSMPGGGTLTVRAWSRQRHGKNWAAVEVRDTGEGISKEVQERIFHPFFSTKGEGRGAGLGLPTALATAESMGGSLDLVSEPGHGSTFTFHLPAASPTADVSGRGHGAEADAVCFGGKGGTVLVVEDEEEITRFVERILARRGCKSLRARTGLEALETLRMHEDELSLILLDLVLPELSGSSIYRAIAACVPRIPVVFMTGQDDLAEQTDKAIPVLRKPFSELELLGCARRAIEGRK